MKRWHYVSIISMLVTAGLAGAGALVVGQSRVPSEAIASSVTRTPELLERAWHLPVAATFHRHISWQSNSSLCGPAAVANAYRSLGEAASTEHLLYVREPQLLLARALKGPKRVQLARCDLILFKLILCLEECPHVSDERLRYSRR
jgi:hypothetical protein